MIATMTAYCFPRDVPCCDRVLTCSERRTVGAVGSSHHPVPRRSPQGSWMPRCSWHLIHVCEHWQEIAKKLTPALARDRALHKVAMVMAY